MHHKPVRIVKLILLITVLSFAVVNVVEAKTYTINFIGITQSYPYFNAYGYDYQYSIFDTSPDTPSSETSPPSDYTEFTDVQYQLIWYKDGKMAHTNYETHYFIFKLPEKNATDSVRIRWYGQANDDDDYVRLYIYNWAAGEWLYTGKNIEGGPDWIDYTPLDPDPYISDNGYIHLAIVGDPEGWEGFLDLDNHGNPYTDYIELIVEVNDSYVQTFYCNIEDISGAPRDWDGFFDDDIISVQAQVTTVPPYYPSIYLKADWGSGSGIFGGGFVNPDGTAIVSGKPIGGGVSDKWRVTLKVGVGDGIANGIPYEAICNEKAFAENIAITPGSYDITLVGRMYYSGGADWVRVNWYVDENSVIKPYPIPVVQKFMSNRASVTIWKYGIDDYCTDPNCHKEGINENNGYDSDTDWNGACIAVGSTTPMCGRDPAGGCYGDPEGPHAGRHDCVYFSGYRVGPFIQMNIPDHALGWLAATVVDLIGGTLDAFMRSTTYNQHEGPDGVLLGLNTEQSFTHGVLDIIGADPKGGLGVVGFIGLIADNEHAVGIMLGHRYGIHPFVMVVTTVPEYPSLNDVSGWENYMEPWLYYLLKNTAYAIKTTGEELSVWNLRYESQQDILNLNRAFNDFITDFLPYAKEALWLIVNCGPTVNHPFIVATFIQFKDNFEIVKTILANSTLRDEFGNVIGEALVNLPNIVGPPDASTGINYLLSYRSELDETEKVAFAEKTLRLLDQIVELIITVLKEVPRMEYNPSNIGWDTNWIAGWGEG